MQHHPRKILIVDDDTSVREMLTELFEAEQYVVVACGSGEEALLTLERENIQVMFFDLKLPGINGIELCGQVRAYNPIAICYAMTAYITLFELTECREAGFDDYFIKPIDSAVFLKAAMLAFEKLERWKQR